jgi:nucleoside-diphosphate-sugar epimerase
MTSRHLQEIPLVVTGADGRVGRLLQAAWTAQPPKGVVPIWCARNKGHWQDLLAGPLDPAPNGAIVLHLAADLSDGGDALARSAAMAQSVAHAARQGRARHILFASTAAVYAPADVDLAEGSPCRPMTPYGHAKLLSEMVCRAAAGLVPMTALRIGNVLGAGALIGSVQGDGLIRLDPVPGRSGGPMRSWIAPGELARLLCQLSVLAGQGTVLPDVLNLASPGAWTMGDMLDAAGYPWAYGPDRAQVLPRLTLDTSRLAATCAGLGAPTPVEMMADLRRTQAHRVPV